MKKEEEPDPKQSIEEVVEGSSGPQSSSHDATTTTGDKVVVGMELDEDDEDEDDVEMMIILTKVAEAAAEATTTSSSSITPAREGDLEKVEESSTTNPSTVIVAADDHDDEVITTPAASTSAAASGGGGGASRSNSSRRTSGTTAAGTTGMMIAGGFPGAYAVSGPASGEHHDASASGVDDDDDVEIGGIISSSTTPHMMPLTSTRSIITVTGAESDSQEDDLVATPVEDGTMIPLQHARPSSIKRQRRQHQREDSGETRGWWRRHGLIAAMIIVALFAIGMIGIYVGLLSGRKEGKSSKPTVPPMTPTTTSNTPTIPTGAPPTPTVAEDIFMGQLPSSTMQMIVAEKDSPQAEAYRWLLNDPNLESYPIWRRIQRFALATLFLSTNGRKSWKHNDNWLSYYEHECSWVQEVNGGWNSTIYNSGNGDLFVDVYLELVLGYYKTGIVNYGTFGGNDNIDNCNGESGRIQKLSLFRNGLAGTIPPEIGLLTSLKQILFFQNSALKSTIPSQIGLLTNLEILHLSNNYEMLGPIPTTIGALSNVRSFSLASMSTMGGTIPTEIGLMTSLFAVHIQETSLSGALPSEIGELQDLRFLHAENALWTGTGSGTVPLEFFRLTNLRYLQAERSFFGPESLSSSSGSEIHKLSSLEYINLSNNGITGSLPAAALTSLVKLRFLGLHDNNLSGSLPAAHFLSDKLEFLQLHSNNLSGPIPTQIASLTNLVDLTLYDNPSLYGTIPNQVCVMTAESQRIAQEVLPNCSTTTTGGTIKGRLLLEQNQQESEKMGSTINPCGCGQCHCSSSA